MKTIRFRVIATVVTASVAVAGTVSVASGQTGGSRFTLGVLPDTQFYSRYSTPDTGNLFQQRYGSEPYAAQAQFLVDHQDELNIPFTTHLGDVVDQANVEQEWEVADRSMRILEDGGMNYSILPGNHDKLGTNPTPFTHWFSADRAAQNSTFGERYDAPNNESEFHIFEAEGQKYLVLALAWRADDATLDWAQSIIDAHPDLPTILTTHESANIDGDGNVFLSKDYGEHLWNRLISKNDQIFLTMGGHHHGAGYTVQTNDAGHDVVNVLQDYQMAYQGGNGLLGLLQFDLTGNELDMTALSPWVAKKDADSLNQFDHLILEDDADSWTVPMNFKERFAGFAPDWEPGEADDPDYAEQARAIVSNGYTEPKITAGQLPISADDYPVAERTAAHWRPGQATRDGVRLKDGDVAGQGTVVPDISGNGNDMTRAALATRGAIGSRDEDVRFTGDKHPLSADEGSLAWADPGANAQRLNWFETAADAAVNKETFADGYTFESFIKIDEAFDGDNAWMGALSREGSRGDIGVTEEGEEPPASLAVSSLREMQWSMVATEGKTQGASNWSHEVPKGEWLHVAIVNDPSKKTVEMFINGAPILRDVLDANGLASADEPWLMGAAMWAGNPANPWFGSIGETRLTHGALKEDRWLTARTHGGGDNAGSVDGSVGGSVDGSGKKGILGGIILSVAAVLALLAGWAVTQPKTMQQVREFFGQWGVRF